MKDYNRNVPFDASEYQAMAFNFAKYNDIQTVGVINDYNSYKFHEVLPLLNVNEICKNPYHNFKREPLYPLFLGFIYKTFGVYPKLAMYIQLILLIIVASFLPWIGYKFWKETGLMAGIISGPIFLYLNSFIASMIMPECLVIFSLFLIIVGYIYYQRKNNFFYSLFLGILFGISILVKKSIILVPVLFCLYLFITYLKNKDKNILKSFLIIITAIFITILPWTIISNIISYKQTQHSKNEMLKNNITLPNQSELNNYKFFFITNQSFDKLLLDGHNEYAPGYDYITKNNKKIYLYNGGWASENWLWDKNSFYNTDKMQNHPGFIRVVNFYLHYPNKFLGLLIEKLNQSYLNLKFLWLILLLYFLDSYKNIVQNYLNKKILKYYYIANFPVILTGICLICNYIEPIKYNFLFYLVFIIIPFIPLIFFKSVKNQVKSIISIPVILKIIFINFFLITIILFGFQRLTQVMDFFIILIAIVYLLKYCNCLFIKILQLSIY